MESARNIMNDILDYERRLGAEQSALRSAKEALGDRRRALYRCVENELLKNDALYRARSEALAPLRVLADKFERYYSVWYYTDGGEDKEWYSPYPHTEEELKPLVTVFKEFYNKFCKENVDARAKKAAVWSEDFMGATEKEIEAHEKEISKLQSWLEERYTTLKYDSDIIIPGTTLDAIQKKMAELSDPGYEFTPLPHIRVEDGLHLYATVQISLEETIDAEDQPDDLSDIFSTYQFEDGIDPLIEKWYEMLFEPMEEYYDIAFYPDLDRHSVEYDVDGDTVTATGTVTIDIRFTRKEGEK